MLRFLAWRLMFEVSNLKRLLGHGAERINYLAFGANLSDAVLRERRIEPLAVRPFVLRDHGLRFDHPAPHAGCSYASVEPAPGETAYGYLYTLSGRDAARMDFYEVVPIIERYRRSWVEQDGERLFYYQSNRSTPGLKPTAQYLGYIVDGLNAHPDACPEYRRALAATETAEPGRLVDSYLRPRPEGLAPWLRRIDGAWQLLTLIVFLYLLYPLSPTAPLIRVRAAPIDANDLALNERTDPGAGKSVK